MARPFRLQVLERLRGRVFQDARLVLGRAVAARQAVSREVARLRGEEGRTRQELRLRMSSPGQVLVLSDLADAFRAQRGRTLEKLKAARAAENEARERVVATRQQLRAVERLRERRHEEALMEEHRAEERNLNDLNAGRYVRRTLEGA